MAEEAGALGWKSTAWIVPALIVAGLVPAFGAPAVASEDLAHALDGCDLELRSQALDAALEAPAPPTEERIVPEGCTGIRPGARLGNVGCTFNFVYTDGVELYIGTAGHCVSMGQRISASGVGFFGTVVLDVCCASNNDVALIQVDADKRHLVDPTLCTWGGPEDLHTGSASAGDLLFEYGWGIATQFSPWTRSRALSLVFLSGGSAVWAGVGSGGDSGGPIVDAEGEAFAIHTFGITPIAGVVYEGGPTVERIVQIAADEGLALSVVTGDPFRVPAIEPPASALLYDVPELVVDDLTALEDRV